MLSRKDWFASTASPRLRTMGRSIPSEQGYHSPGICIDARHHLAGDVLDEAAIVLRVRRHAQRESFPCRVSHEQLLAGDAEVLTTMSWVNLGGVRPQPVSV